MIKRLFIAECGRCHLFAAPDSYPNPAFTDLTLSATRTTEHDAVAYAVKRGWCAYPLLCPTCNERYQEAMRRGETLHDDPPAEGDGAVRTTGPDAERAPGGR